MTTPITAQDILKTRFPATGSDGKTYEVRVYVQTPSAETKDQIGPIEKISSLRTSEGAELRMIGKGHYEIVDGGVTLRSTSRDAI